MMEAKRVIKKENKWICGAIPALLLHCSIGTVYCWSYFKADIASYIGASKSSVEWGFSLAIFVLGMSAAFAGDIVEQNIKLSSKIACYCFSIGLALTGLFVYLKSLPGILISYGLIMGIGLGLGYLSPVKTLMLWFKNNKGLATGIAHCGFWSCQGNSQSFDLAFQKTVLRFGCFCRDDSSGTVLSGFPHLCGAVLYYDVSGASATAQTLRLGGTAP